MKIICYKITNSLSYKFILFSEILHVQQIRAIKLFLILTHLFVTILSFKNK